ncbi:porin family protein [uncultured Hymenobacter sp.]|uniref:porin family protein n=1 Tax=uncultured Hymenobacter sp. TaxID=170016 RepID=UPI0035C9BA5C
MKKFFLLAALAAASISGAQAQARAGGELSSKDYTGGAVTDSRNTGFGIKGGYNYTNLYGDGADQLDLRGTNTFHAGVYGQFGFNDFASTQIELLYSRKGAKTNGSGTADDVRLDYLQLPILFVGNVTETISFHVGPQISLLTKYEQNGQDYAIDDSGLNSLDFGGVAGLEFRVGPARVGGRYDLGLGKVFDTSKANRLNVTEQVRNGTVQVYIGLGFTQ